MTITATITGYNHCNYRLNPVIITLAISMAISVAISLAIFMAISVAIFLAISAGLSVTI